MSNSTHLHCQQVDTASAAAQLEHRITEVGHWMSANRLKLNTYGQVQQTCAFLSAFQQVRELFCIFVFGCQYQCNRSPGKTRHRYDLLCVELDTEPYSNWTPNFQLSFCTQLRVIYRCDIAARECHTSCGYCLFILYYSCTDWNTFHAYF